MCIYDNPPTLCTSFCGHDPAAAPVPAQALPNSLLALQLLMEQQAPALQCISEQMQHLKDSIRAIRTDLVGLRLMPKFAAAYPKPDSTQETPLTVNANQLVSFLCGPDCPSHRRALKLASDLPSPLYKHQSFR